MASINTVAVFGSGLMGSGIAQIIAQADVKVRLADVTDKALQ
jgi:3-hydroxyacyl-CoA dehydrogenase